MCKQPLPKIDIKNQVIIQNGEVHKNDWYFGHVRYAIAACT